MGIVFATMEGAAFVVLSKPNRARLAGLASFEG
jgi:hypothetical protein